MRRVEHSLWTRREVALDYEWFAPFFEMPDQSLAPFAHNFSSSLLRSDVMQFSGIFAQIEQLLLTVLRVINVFVTSIGQRVVMIRRAVTNMRSEEHTSE